jgi:hypothetical protein
MNQNNQQQNYPSGFQVAQTAFVNPAFIPQGRPLPFQPPSISQFAMQYYAQQQFQQQQMNGGFMQQGIQQGYYPSVNHYQQPYQSPYQNAPSFINPNPTQVNHSRPTYQQSYQKSNIQQQNHQNHSYTVNNRPYRARPQPVL